MEADDFAEALRPHYDDAVRYCRALCARWSPGEADDVLQQALLQALEHHGSRANRASLVGATNYVNQVMEEALACRPISVSATQPYGCAVRY